MIFSVVKYARSGGEVSMIQHERYRGQKKEYVFERKIVLKNRFPCLPSFGANECECGTVPDPLSDLAWHV